MCAGKTAGQPSLCPVWTLFSGRVAHLPRAVPLPHSGHIRHNEPVSTGKRAGSRRGPSAPRTLNRAALVIGAAITLCVVAWGYLVYAAIDFGTAARGGNSSAWSFMALACVGAMACLFVGLLLVARLLRALGITSPPPSSTSDGPRPVGGKRAAR